MKTLYALEWLLVVGLSASVAIADPCTLSNGQIELNNVTASGGNCILNLKYSFSLDKNKGNKFAYVHFWKASSYANPDYKKGPTKSELGNVLGTIAISTDDPVTLLSTYPDNTVTPLFAGLTISQVNLGGGLYRITIDNILLTVPGACSGLPNLIADVWATQSNDKETPPIHYLLKGNDTPLPVTLARFDGSLLDNAVSLSWTTAEEAGASYFDIERSANAREFVHLGRVAAKGNSSVTQHYGFADSRPLVGDNYYRLRMVDLDGSSEYSRVITIDNGIHSVAFELLGNPASNREIKFLLKNEDVSQIKLTDMSGKTIRFSLGQSANEFVLRPKGHLSSGLYLLSLQRDGVRTVTKKVLVP